MKVSHNAKTGRMRVERGNGTSFEYVPFATKTHPCWPLIRWRDTVGFGRERPLSPQFTDIS